MAAQCDFEANGLDVLCIGIAVQVDGKPLDLTKYHVVGEVRRYARESLEATFDVQYTDTAVILSLAPEIQKNMSGIYYYDAILVSNEAAIKWRRTLLSGRIGITENVTIL